MRPSLDLTGKRFGKLTVFAKSDRVDNQGTVWVVLCDCGKFKEVPRRRFARKELPMTHCGCAPVWRFSEKFTSMLADLKAQRWVGVSGLTRRKWRELKKGARSRKLEFTIHRVETDEIFAKQGGICALSGKQMLKLGEAGSDRNSGASLDRIDSSKGYIPGNVQWVQLRVNLMKSNLPEGDFVELCRLISNHRSLG